MTIPLRRRPKSIPKQATLRITQDMGENGACGVFSSDSRDLVSLCWDEDGNSDWEIWFDKKGERRLELERHWGQGAVTYRCPYRNGLPHGLVQQWDKDGVLLLETRFENGTGADLWWADGFSEHHPLVDGRLHGADQWWADSKTVYEETA
ncbi:MAG TPA: hypothetical protein VH083_21095, partial [Myxococcales bacterium]|nr:hypothetical protein [Myxococcales bacterium]